MELASNENANVSNPERWASVVAGSAMAAYGLAKRSATGLAIAGLGGALVWRGASGGGATDNAGSVHFTPTSHGTEVKVTLRYDPPGGTLGAAAAKLFGEDPAHQVQEELRHFKQIVETGEVATTEGQPVGR